MGTEQVFKFPGFFDREIDLSQRVKAPLGTPAGIIGTAQSGPAFVPVTVGSMPDFRTKFGGLDAKRFGPYAVNEFLKHRSAVTYLRVLGAGGNDTSTDIGVTRLQGTVVNAGFKVLGQAAAGLASGSRNSGGVVFLTAQHSRRGGEALGFPVFTDNNSFGNGTLHLVRAMIMVASGSRVLITSSSTGISAGSGFDNSDDNTRADANGQFKIILSSSFGASAYGTGDGVKGIRILTASLNPTSNNYIAKVLNTNPDRFSVDEHLLYAEFPVEDEIATVAPTAVVALVSGSQGTSATSGDPTQSFANAYGRFDTRFTTPSTPWIISQPYGSKEFNLFKFEALSDGVFSNSQIKVSIAQVKKSTDPTNEYGTFAVQVRAFDDTDLDPKVIEQYPNCSLDPSSQNYVAKLIGDTKVYYQFDADSEDERRLIVKGRFPNKSNLVRVTMDPAVEGRITPASALPFGFHGPTMLNTNDQLGDVGQRVTSGLTARRLALFASGTNTLDPGLTGSIVPPLPYTFKVTRGAVSTAPQFEGYPGIQETTDGRIYWGVKTTRVTPTGSLTNAILDTNGSSVTNPLVRTFTKFMGIAQLDALVTGSATDQFNSNKFSLARVALSNGAVTDLTGTANQHMLGAVYSRNAQLNPVNYTILDSISGATRITLGTLVNLTSSVEFNRFVGFNKFTSLLFGGFDGINILDPDASRLDDKFTSSDANGGANSATLSPGLSYNANGVGQLSNGVRTYQAATRIMTDELTVNSNILAIPGIRDSFITDFAALRSRQNGLIFYVQDIVQYDEGLNRLFGVAGEAKPDVRQTTEQFAGRAVDNNYAAAYFPDVIIDDLDNNKKVKVPSTVATLGALAFNDKVGFPWFAPAGFNRGGLDFVSNTDVRLGKDDRDLVYDSRINPIVHFPRQGTSPIFVIFGQKTLQMAASALDRVNVRRMLLEVKRIIVKITREGFVFEQNTKATRDKWINQVTPQLALVQTQAGIDAFKIVMDESNNTQDDIENNRLNGKIVIVPTRTVEFIAIDFIITNAGVTFSE